MRRYVLILSLPLVLTACDQLSALQTQVATDMNPPQTAAESIQAAQTLRKGGRLQAAVDVLLTAVEKNPGDSALLSQLGYALISTGDNEGAVGIFDRLIAMNPQDALAYNGKGVAFDNAGNHLAAQDIYAKALAISPESTTIKNNLALSLILNDQLTAAVRLLEKLAREQPDNKTVRQNLALAYGLSGQNEKAFALNLQDMSRDKAEANDRYYSEYVRRHALGEKIDINTPITIGFSNAPASTPVLPPPTEPAPATAPNNSPEASATSTPLVHVSSSESGATAQ